MKEKRICITFSENTYDSEIADYLKEIESFAGVVCIEEI